MYKPLYQHRKGKIKLVKDLNQGKAHLRQSLIYSEDMEDLHKVFEQKKKHYKIDQIQINEQKPVQVQASQEQHDVNFLLSPEERLEMYRKQRINKKLNQKISNMQKNTQQPKKKYRKEIINKLLNNFQQNQKRQVVPKAVSQLKESINNLSSIKINTRRKATFHAPTTDSLSVSRKRMISLENSHPQFSKEMYPSIGQIIKNRYTDTQISRYCFDVSHLEHQLNSIVPFLSQNKNKHQKPQNRSSTHQQLCKQRLKEKNKKQEGEGFSNSIYESSNKSFTRSQKSSKRVICTMTDFYRSKKKKTQEYDEMVDILIRDRPISTQIRRKNYKIVEGQKVNSVKVYRNISEIDRRNILKKNHDFYMTLIAMLEKCPEGEIRTSISILNKIKLCFETEFILTKNMFNRIVDSIPMQNYDYKTQQLIDTIQQFVEVNTIDTQ